MNSRKAKIHMEWARRQPCTGNREKEADYQPHHPLTPSHCQQAAAMPPMGLNGLLPHSWPPSHQGEKVNRSCCSRYMPVLLWRERRTKVKCPKYKLNDAAHLHRLPRAHKAVAALPSGSYLGLLLLSAGSPVHELRSLPPPCVAVGHSG